ncbi:MAG: hypothetical protein R2712_09545 [Vicinamibacterales bacterium]
MYNGQWQRVWTNRLFTDVKVGLFGFGWPMAPAVPFESDPPRTDQGTGVNTRAPAGWRATRTAVHLRPQQAADHATGTYYPPNAAGSHDFKFGFEWMDDQSKFASNGASGPILYRDPRRRRGDIIRITDGGHQRRLRHRWTGADDRNGRIALFFQDRWALSAKLSLDSRRPHGPPAAALPDSVRTPVVSEVFPAVTVPAATLLTSTKIVPRIGVSYLPTDDGRTVIKGFAWPLLLQLRGPHEQPEPRRHQPPHYRFNDINGNRLYDGPQGARPACRLRRRQQHHAGSEPQDALRGTSSTSRRASFWGESSARVAYVRKMTHDEFATTVNILRVGQFNVPTTVNVNIQDYVNGVTSQQTLQVFDIPASLRGQVQNVVTNIPDTVGGGDDDFDTMTFSFQKRFPGGLFFQSSFDYQWRNELRRGDSVSTSPLTADPIATGYNANGESFPTVANRQKSQNWSARFLGRYIGSRHEIGFATNVRMQSGWPYARRASHSLPNAGTATVFLEDIDNNYSDQVTIVDFRLDKSFTVNRYKFSVIADLFNALNSNAVTNFNLLNGSQFNRIIATLDPRTFQLAARFEF